MFFHSGPEALPVNAELAHPGPKRVGIDLQERGRPMAAFDLTFGMDQGGFDMASHGFIQSQMGRG